MTKPRLDRAHLQSGAWCWRCYDEYCYGLGTTREEAYNCWKSVSDEFELKRANDVFNAALRMAEQRNGALCFPTSYGIA